MLVPFFFLLFHTMLQAIILYTTADISHIYLVKCHFTTQIVFFNPHASLILTKNFNFISLGTDLQFLSAPSVWPYSMCIAALKLVLFI